MFAGRCGAHLMLDDLCDKDTASLISTLFNEELAAVFQVRKSDVTEFNKCFATCGPPPGLIRSIGQVAPTKNQNLAIYHGTDLVYRNSRAELQRLWSSTSYHIQRERDNPECADAEFDTISDDNDPGLSYHLTFDPSEDILPFKARVKNSLLSRITNTLTISQKPRIAVLREQGVNGAPEMSFAFMAASFEAFDVVSISKLRAPAKAYRSELLHKRYHVLEHH